MKKAADSFPKVDDADIQILFEQRKLTFQPSGASTFHIWRIYRILTADGAKSWGTLSADWEPWHEDRPKIRARTIDLNNQVHPIDPATIAETTTGDQSSNVLSDTKRLSVPIPALVAGALVEEEIEIQEQKPAYSGGSMRRFFMDSGTPVQWSQIIVQAPTSLPFRYRLFKLTESEATKESTPDTIRLTVAKGPLPAVKEIPPLMPFSEPRYFGLAVSTGESWQKFAATYSAVVDAQLEGSNLKSWVSNLKGTREEKISALMARLHQEIRYTGIEFGEAAIVPAKPAEVIKRKLGDCKDKSTLLVALLRAAGIPADIALLSSGGGLDIHPDLPGGGLFNHAIVYVPGTPDYWIDATDEFAKLGQIHASNQSRWAVIANPATTGLKLVPQTSSADNHTTEIREFFLPSLGKSRIVETTRVSGTGESSFRNNLSSRDRKAVEKGLEDYVKEEYLTESLKTWKADAASDLNRPFELRLEVEKAKRGSVDTKAAAVGVLLSKLTDNMPEFFLEKPDPKAAPKPATARSTPYWIREPYTKEWVYRIHVPDGFRLRKGPMAGKRQLGTATLQTEIGTIQNGLLEARFVFDSGKTVLTPEEAVATRDAIVELRKESVPLIEFEQIGEALLTQGKPLEALAEFRALCKKHPNDALERTRLARALTVVGLGETARQEARKATELEPKSATAWYTLGMILQYDLIGRLRQTGFDYEGAIQAFRKGKELDPEDPARADLAILLEHNAAGVRYSKDSRLTEAISEYKALGEQAATLGIGGNILYALAYAGQFEELRKEAAKGQQTVTTRALALVATTHLSSAKAALEELATASLDDNSRRTILQTAGNLLLHLRNYPAAADVLTALARNASNAAALMNSALVVGKTTKFEDRKLDPENPADFAHQFLVLRMAEDQIRPELATKLFSKLVATSLAESDIKASAREFRKASVNASLPRKTLVDIGLSSARFTVDGTKDTLARVKIDFAGQGQETMFLIWEDSQWKMLASPTALSLIGSQALKFIAAGEVPKARKVLDWARELTPAPQAEDPAQGLPFARLWQRGQEADPEAVRIAAASLACTDKTDKECLGILRTARQSLLNQPAQRAPLDVSLFLALQARDQWPDIDSISAKLLEDFPRSERAFALRLANLLQQSRTAEAHKIIDARLKLFPDDPVAIRALVSTSEVERDYKAQRTHIARLEQLGQINSSDLNSLIWATLVDGTTNAQTVEQALRAAQIGATEFPILHSVAAVLAQQGKTNEALSTLLQAMKAAGMEEPEDSCWLVLGRIAQELGFPDLAKARYARMEKPKKSLGARDDFSSYSIAQKWMAAK